MNQRLNRSAPHSTKWSHPWTFEHSAQLLRVLLFFSGPPGPPEAVAIDEITDTTAQLSWRPGPDSHSPITMYVIQARTPFSVGWQAVNTGTMLDAWCWCLTGASETQQNGHSSVAEAERRLGSHSDTATDETLWQCFLYLNQYTIWYFSFYWFIFVCLLICSKQ